MTYTDAQNLIATLATLTLTPLPILMVTAILARILFPKYDHEQ